MPQVRWEDISNLRHAILGLAQKAQCCEIKGKAFKEACLSVLDIYNEVVNKIEERENGTNQKHSQPDTRSYRRRRGDTTDGEGDNCTCS